MKKLLRGKVLAALIIFAASSYFVNLQGQVSFSFPNDSVNVGDGSTGGIQPVTLRFEIDDAGKISLNASSKNDSAAVTRVVDSWDSDSVGNTDNAALFGKSFALVATSSKSRLQCNMSNGGGLGVRGQNQWRLDGGTDGEAIYFTLF